MKPVGIARETSAALHRVIDEMRWVSNPVHLIPTIGITGPVPRETTFEDTGGAFFLDPEGRQADPVEDDLALWIETPAGTVIVTGCCHAGLVNTIECVRRCTAGVRPHTVIGGFHLLTASPERIGATGGYLESIGLKRIVPCHCTGEQAAAELTARFGRRTVRGCTGKLLRW
jgi:7,8-dihydropterin-6-yl-methyl-4-(beta-D-ribofuranosyl)aminobenzene 5'-phosphate synthase